jgi:putative ABC transport system ATP-binding protein
MLKIQNLTKIFFPGTVYENIVLRNINLNVDKSEFVTIIGGNGAGKSTLLNSIAGVFPIEQGSIEINGENVVHAPEYQRAHLIGRVFQNPLQGTAASLTVEENLAIAALRGKHRRLRLAVTEPRRKEFREKLSFLGLGLESRLKEQVGLLSGGQRQALTMLMATMARPQLLLLDEHTASLDPKTAEQIIFLTKKLVSEYQLTTLMVTHNMEQALIFGNRTIMMHQGEIIFDIRGREREKMTVKDLLEKFNEVRKEKLAEDRMLLT